MDISAAALSPDGTFLAVGGCSKPLDEDLRSGNIFCDGQDSTSPGGVPFLLILDASTEEVIAVIPENEAETAIADLAFTPDGEKLIYAVHPGKFVVWDMNSGEVESILWEGETSAPNIAVSRGIVKWLSARHQSLLTPFPHLHKGNSGHNPVRLKTFGLAA